MEIEDFLQHRPYLRKCLKYRGVSDIDIEDLLQDTYIKAKISMEAGAYVDKKKLKGWLSYVVINLWRDFVKKKKEVLLNEEHRFILENAQYEEYDDTYDERLSKVHRAVLRLSEDQQNILNETVSKGKGFKEIAEETGLSINTLLGQKRYAVNNIKKLLWIY